MLGIMLQKILHKKWINLCLLLGCVLLVATAVSFPLYQGAAYDRMLQDTFRSAEAEDGTFPSVLSMTTVSKKEKDGSTIRRMEELLSGLAGTLHVTGRENISYYRLSRQAACSTMNRSDLGETEVRPGALSGLAEHAVMLSGEMYSESGMDEEGCIEVVISQACMVNLGVLTGETLVLKDLTDASGGQIKLVIKGVFGAADEKDAYWQVSPDDMENVCLMEPELFERMFTGENAGKYTITCSYYFLFQYDDLKSSQVSDLIETTDYLTQESPYRSTFDTPAYLTLLESYQKKQSRIQATLLILQIPVLILLGAFLFMISGQMYELEKNEISVIRSRGSSGAQIFRLYLYQNLFLTLLGGLLGIPLGEVFARILGSARNFLEFDTGVALTPHFTADVWGYAAAAMTGTLLIMTLPAVRHSRVTIVKLKQQRAVGRKSWWEKIFLDLILLFLSLYGYYSFRKNTDELAESVLTGQALDPLLYLTSSLFIVGMGLLALRLQPLLLKLVFTLGKRFWKPASYASFLENIKNGRKQQFIMLFLIMTISLGMYHAAAARTILQNTEDNVEYLDGCDVIIKEKWETQKDRNGAVTGLTEPDFDKYAALEWADGYTKVLYDTRGSVVVNSSMKLGGVTVMGIHTKQFGSITWVDQDLNGKHYYEYLNELALEPEGVLLSENFRGKQGLSVGDTITFANEEGTQIKGKILDFFSYWPGYVPETAVLNPDGSADSADNYMVVAGYNRLFQSFGLTPYEVWIGVKDGYDAEDVYDWIEENGLHLSKYVNRENDVESAVEDPLLQGTNGVLTMGFLVTLLLCTAGYLIYWIMSIRSREMVFGVLRACGMHRGELIHMLMNEQIFSGLFSVLAGIGIGRLTSVMFVPMLQEAYAASDQVLPMKLVMDSSDLLRLYGVIGGMMVLALGVLIFLLFHMNVTKALKLGEE